MIGLVDHESLKSGPLDERAGRLVDDTRGIWPDQTSKNEKKSAISDAS